MHTAHYHGPLRTPPVQAALLSAARKMESTDKQRASTEFFNRQNETVSISGSHNHSFQTLCILLLTIHALIQPDVCDMERGFSVMNYIKNQHGTQLTQQHLNVAVAVAMDNRSVTDFPFNKC